MKGLLEREFVAQLTIILGISLAGWFFFVNPKAEKLREMQLLIETVSHGDNELSQADIENLARLISKSHSSVKAIVDHNKLAENSTLLYGIVSDLGAKNDVTVRSLTPGSRISHQSSSGFTATRMDMVLEGQYENLAAFVESLHDLPGFIRPVGLGLKPAGDSLDALVIADFSCELIEFTLPEELLRIGDPE